MNRVVMATFFLAASGLANASGEVRVQAEPVYVGNSLVTQDAFPADVDFTLEALYPRRNNQAKARIEIRYSCRDTQTGGLVVPCYIRLDPPTARQDSGGHISSLHSSDRPTGRHVPSEGYVSEQTGYLNATYYAPEVGGVVQSIIHCATGWGGCSDGTVTFGVGLQTLEDLGQGSGYTLTGAKTPHPSNHWGVPNFLSAVRAVATLFARDYPDSPLLYNDISLEYGGVFDVATTNQAGYDWTPPHSSHRLGTNMDIGIPRGNAQRALLLRLYQTEGVRVLQEDAYHWHLMY